MLSTSTNMYFNRPDGSKMPIQASMKMCHGAGYRRMDFNFLDCTTFRLPFVTPEYESWLEEIAALGEELDITFSQCHLPFYNVCDPNAPEREFKDAMVYRGIDCAARLGIPCAVTHAGTVLNTSQSRSRSQAENIAYFSPVLEYAEKKGVMLTFENLWDYRLAPKRLYTTEVEDLMELVNGFHTSKIGVCYDTDHAELMRQNHVENLYMMKDYLVATHISDCINVDSDHLFPFYGTVDWALIMKTLKEINYQGDFTYEALGQTRNIPDALIPSVVAHSVEIGNYLLSL